MAGHHECVAILLCEDHLPDQRTRMREHAVVLMDDHNSRATPWGKLRGVVGTVRISRPQTCAGVVTAIVTRTFFCAFTRREDLHARDAVAQRLARDSRETHGHARATPDDDEGGRSDVARTGCG